MRQFARMSSDPRKYARIALLLSALAATLATIGGLALAAYAGFDRAAVALAGLAALAGVAALVAAWFFAQSLHEERRTHARTRSARDKLELDLLVSERARFETEQYQQFARKLHSTAHVFELIDEIFDYVEANFGLEASVLYLADFKTGFLEHYRSRYPDFVPREQVERMRQFRIPLSPEGGMHWAVCRRKRPVYFPHFRESDSFFDRIGQETLNLKSLLMVPLVISGEVIGLINFTNFQRPLKLSRDNIRSVSAFCDQIAGAVKSSLLLAESNEARRKAETARREVERQRRELERLNEFSRKANALTSIDELLEEVFGYFFGAYGISGIWLQFLDEGANELYTYRSTRPQEITEEQLRYIRELRVPLGPDGGIAARVYERQRPVYLPKPAPERYTTETDLKTVRELKIRSFLYCPLVLGERTIGVISFTRFEKRLNLKRMDIASIERFCNQIAGAVNSSRLHAETDISRLVAEERLAEVQKLKSQQDLDYYLTANLIEPLAGVHLSGGELQVTSFVRQKKRFPYKRWVCEIGGDLNLARNIRLGGESYAAFVNADAMGKSIQGAGGALTLAAVLRTILDRSMDLYGVSPEEWLAAACTELDNIFRNFDGAMYISFALGLAHEASGYVWWVSAEHPLPVFYRNGAARLLPLRSNLHKLGFLLGRRRVLVDSLRLEPGDRLVFASDGRDDILVGQDMNQDEDLFVRTVERAGGDPEQCYLLLRERGQVTDDFSALTLTYAGLGERAGSDAVRASDGEALLDAFASDAGSGAELEAQLEAAVTRILEIGAPLNPGLDDLYRRLAAAHLKAALAADATRLVYDRALAYLRLDPGASDCLLLAARAARRLGDPASALSLLTRHLLREGESAAALQDLFELRVAERNLAEAEAVMERLLALNVEREEAETLRRKVERLR